MSQVIKYIQKIIVTTLITLTMPVWANYVYSVEAVSDDKSLVAVISEYEDELSDSSIHYTKPVLINIYSTKTGKKFIPLQLKIQS